MNGRGFVLIFIITIVVGLAAVYFTPILDWLGRKFERKYEKMEKKYQKKRV